MSKGTAYANSRMFALMTTVWLALDIGTGRDFEEALINTFGYASTLLAFGFCMVGVWTNVKDAS